jgi:hypothetical protein
MGEIRRDGEFRPPSPLRPCDLGYSRAGTSVNAVGLSDSLPIASQYLTIFKKISIPAMPDRTPQSGLSAASLKADDRELVVHQQFAFEGGLRGIPCIAPR